MKFIIEKKDKEFIKEYLKDINLYEYDLFIEIEFKEDTNYNKITSFIINYFFEKHLKRSLNRNNNYNLDKNMINYIKNSTLDEKFVREYSSFYIINKSNLKEMIINIVLNEGENEETSLNINGLINFRKGVFLNIADNIINSYITKNYIDEEYFVFLQTLKEIKSENKKYNGEITISKNKNKYLILNSNKKDITKDFFNSYINEDKYIACLLFCNLKFDLLDSIIPYIIDYSPKKIIYDKKIINKKEDEIVKILSNLFNSDFSIQDLNL